MFVLLLCVCWYFVFGHFVFGHFVLGSFYSGNFECWRILCLDILLRMTYTESGFNTRAPLEQAQAHARAQEPQIWMTNNSAWIFCLFPWKRGSAMDQLCLQISVRGNFPPHWLLDALWGKPTKGRHFNPCLSAGKGPNQESIFGHCFVTCLTGGAGWNWPNIGNQSFTKMNSLQIHCY